MNLVGCIKNYETPDDLFCGPLIGKSIDKELGRVYYSNTSELPFYYIGNPDTLLWNGGVVPCNIVLDTYISVGSVGDLVIYSGEYREPKTKTAEDDPYEPLYGGIELSFIERVK